MKPSTITITVKLKWWFKYIYLPVLIASYQLVIDYINAEAEINQERFYFWLERGIYIDISRAPSKLRA